MEEVLRDITNYLDFLKQQHFYVEISDMDELFSSCMPVLFEYEIHPFPICFYLKSCALTNGKCRVNKQKLCQKQFDKPYYASCYAGVEEYIFPIIYKGKKIANIHVSGFRGKLKSSEKKRAYYAELLGKEFDDIYQLLSVKVPSYEAVMCYAAPLTYMIKTLYEHCLKNEEKLSPERKMYTSALMYMYDHYPDKIACEDIAKSVNLSESYLRFIFKKEAGVPLGKMLVTIRLNKAKEMLKETAYNISEIAYFCGFDDSHYFSYSFKKAFGASPKEFRNRLTEHK